MTPSHWRSKFCIFFAALFVFVSSRNCYAQNVQPAQRIVQAIDSKQLVTLKGNVHPLAHAEIDQGVVADSQPLNRMLLLLERSPSQEAALRQLLDDQQSKASSNFHKWITPEEFGFQSARAVP